MAPAAPLRSCPRAGRKGAAHDRVAVVVAGILGAAVNFITRKPDFRGTKAIVELTATTYDERRVDAYYSAPSAHDLAFNVGGYFSSARGQRPAGFTYDSYHPRQDAHAEPAHRCRRIRRGGVIVIPPPQRNAAASHRAAALRTDADGGRTARYTVLHNCAASASVASELEDPNGLT